MVRRIYLALWGLISNVCAESIHINDIAAFETSGTWQVIYEPWHIKAVESHKHFFCKTYVNEGEDYTNFVPNMTLPSKISWVSSLEPLPETLNGHECTADVLTTMMLDLKYHSFDQKMPSKIDIQVITNQKVKDDWVKVASESTGNSEYRVKNFFRDVFQDTSEQSEFLIGYKNKQPVVAAVLFYEGSYASIYWVSTIPRERRQGFGTALMIDALNRVRRRNIRWVVLQAQPMGEGLYRNLGFIPVGYLVRYEI